MNDVPSASSREPGWIPRAFRHVLRVGFVVFAVAACASVRPAAPMDARTDLVRTFGPNRSLIVLGETDAGFVLIDLGWYGASGALRDALARRGADSSDVAAVFLTHAHLDHIAAWPVVRHAPLHLAEPEVDFFVGLVKYQAWVVRTVDQLLSPDRPEADAVTLRPFAADTMFVFGTDTVRAFVLPGHTPGSAAYLFRGTLFAGDAVSGRLLNRMKAAVPMYTEDARQARATLADLLTRAEQYGVHQVCTAHAQCRPFTSKEVQALRAR